MNRRKPVVVVTFFLSALIVASLLGCSGSNNTGSGQNGGGGQNSGNGGMMNNGGSNNGGGSNGGNGGTTRP